MIKLQAKDHKKLLERIGIKFVFNYVIELVTNFIFLYELRS